MSRRRASPIDHIPTPDAVQFELNEARERVRQLRALLRAAQQAHAPRPQPGAPAPSTTEEGAHVPH